MTRLEKCKAALLKGFSYDEETGNITTPTGVVATKKTMNGYIQLTIRVNGSAMYLLGHQFAWFVSYGTVVDIIDHANRVKTDNRILNLRSVTKSQNAFNMKNIKGYSYSKRSGKFIAYIIINYKRKQLGSFKTEKEASECYLENKVNLHKI